jgi:hypothetical protein
VYFAVDSSICLASLHAFRKLVSYFFILSGVRLNPLGTAAITGLLYPPQMLYDCDCRAVGGVKIGMGNRSTRRKPAPAPLYPPQIPHDQTRPRTWAATVGSQQLRKLGKGKDIPVTGHRRP